ncbi:ATP-binding protein [Macrococcoides canis]|uniref:ATP-binding protein n=1 Tax=Macrococcoides canis TaxID=1855823 RepID=UPI0022B8FBB3|nr:ATP-binding protein [Macrococcus canis]WBF51990.1 ATP-binding protein [Macrococcus canis]
MAKKICDVMKNKNKGITLEQQIENCEQASKVISESEPFICIGCKRKVTEITFENGYKFKFNCHCEAIKMGKKAQAKNEFIKHSRYFEASLKYIPQQYHFVTFDQVKPTDPSVERAKRISERYVSAFSKNNPQSLYFYGGFGLGKTMLSACIMNALKNSYKVMFIDVSMLLNDFKLAWNKDSELAKSNYTEKMMMYIRTADLVIFDDIGAEQGIKTDKSMLNNLVNSRMQKHSIFTSNLKNTELAKDTDYERIFSRMMERCTPVAFAGVDQRRKDKFSKEVYQPAYDLSNPPF